MNYNDQILENKAFSFFKQLMYNIALAICIMLVGVLVLFWCGFRFYSVESPSEQPHLMVGDMAIVKAQDEYKVNDLIKFDTSTNGTLPTTHRLIAIMKDGSGVTHYICHGDNNYRNLDGSKNEDSDWKDDVAYINQLINEGKSYNEIVTQFGGDIQTPTFEQIEGKVVNKISNYGTYFAFLKEHIWLFIALVAGIWCISSVVQNEIEMKKARRLA